MENHTKKIIVRLLAVCMIFAMALSILDSCYAAETKASVNQKIRKLYNLRSGVRVREEGNGAGDGRRKRLSVNGQFQTGQ